MRLAIATVLCWCLPAFAAAQSAVVFVGGDGAHSEALQRARAGLVEGLAERGIRLVRAEGSPQAGAEAADGCDAPGCAAAAASRAGVDFAILARLEHTEQGDEVRVVVVLPRAARGAEAAAEASEPPEPPEPSAAPEGPEAPEAYEASAPVGEAGSSGAAAAALGAALSRMPERRRGFLFVRTDPPGEPVQIDGASVGRSPLRRTVSAGRHTISARRASGERVEQTVTVAALEETSVELELSAGDTTSEPDATGDLPAGPQRTEPSPFNWLLGGGLALGGIVSLISPLQTLAQEGECVERIERAGCVEKVQFGAQSGVLLGVGLALLTAAVVIDAVAPIRVEVQASDRGAAVRLGARF